MSQYVTAQCGGCGKTFRLSAEQLGRNVQCPHCKTLVQIAPPAPAPLAARVAPGAGARRKPRKPDDEDLLKPGSARIRGGIRNRSVAIVWVSILGVAAIALGVLLAGGFLQRWVREHGAPAKPQAGPPPVVSLKGLERGVFKQPNVSDPDKPDYPVQVEGVLRGGVAGENRTLFCGKVTNATPHAVRAMAITIPVLDASKEKIGEAKTIIRDLPAGQSAPLVAVCEHDPTLRPAGYGAPDFQIDAPDVVRPPANLVCEEPAWAEEDRFSEVTPRGTIAQDVVNRGQTPVSAVEVYVLMRANDDHISGAVVETIRLDQPLLPEKTVTLKIPYQYTPRSAIRTVQVWVQAAE